MSLGIETARVLQKAAEAFKIPTPMPQTRREQIEQQLNHHGQPDAVTAMLVEFLVDKKATNQGVDFVGNTMLFHEGGTGIEVRDPIEHIMQPDIEYAPETPSKQQSNEPTFFPLASLAGQTS